MRDLEASCANTTLSRKRHSVLAVCVSVFASASRYAATREGRHSAAFGAADCIPAFAKSSHGTHVNAKQIAPHEAVLLRVPGEARRTVEVMVTGKAEVRVKPPPAFQI